MSLRELQELELKVRKARANVQDRSRTDLRKKVEAIISDAGFKVSDIFGGRGGNAVMLVRNDDGKWSAPAFYTLGGISWGLQFGGQTSELVITIMTEKGLNAVLNRAVTLGADAGLAIGELGRGANAATGMDLNADMYAFARSEGLFVGVSLEGSVLAPRETWNQQMYGQDATPQSISRHYFDCEACRY